MGTKKMNFEVEIYHQLTYQYDDNDPIRHSKEALRKFLHIEPEEETRFSKAYDKIERELYG